MFDVVIALQTLFLLLGVVLGVRAFRCKSPNASTWLMVAAAVAFSLAAGMRES